MAPFVSAYAVNLVFSDDHDRWPYPRTLADRAVDPAFARLKHHCLNLHRPRQTVHSLPHPLTPLGLSWAASGVSP